MRKTQEGEIMLKKFLVAVAVIALVISSIEGTALAADKTEIKEGDVIEVTSLDELPTGEYELDVKMSAWLDAMGGIEFGAPLLTGATLKVTSSGAEMTLNFANNTVTIYGITCYTYLAEYYCYNINNVLEHEGYFGVLDGENWADAKYTLSSEADMPTNANSAYDNLPQVTSMTVPVSTVADTYSLAMAINSQVMGMQFGGPTAPTLSNGKVPSCTLTVNWANTKVIDLIPENAITVSNIADLKPGTYKLDAKLSCFVTAMGGVEFGAPLLTGTHLNVAKDGTATMTLAFGKSSVTIYGITCDTFIDAGADGAIIGYKDSEFWKTAEYTLSTDTALNSTSEAVNYVETLKVPMTNVSDTYALGLYVNSNVMGVQFGGSDDARYTATLTVKWDQTEIIELEKVEDTNNTVNNTTNTDDTTNTTTDASPKTGDKAIIMPILGFVVAGMLLMIAVSMKKETYKRKVDN